MMLKVEAYASGSKKSNPCQAPLYICLATADPETGICLTVGRKEGLVQFTEDKMVSRKDHFVFRFVSTTESAFPCQTPEQEEAANSCLHHLAVVLENQGKRTILVNEPDPNAATANKKKAKTKKKNDPVDDDSATAGSEDTGDENDHISAFASQASSAGEAGILSLAAQEILGKDAASQVKLDMLLPQQSRVLVPLCRKKGRVILQIGRVGSTVLITRVDTISFVKSGTFPKKKMPWMDRLDWVGAHEIKEWTIQQKGHVSAKNDDDEGEQHSGKVSLLVTAKRDPSVKQLAAWSLQIPAVTPGYMEALVARIDPTQPLPDPASYEPIQPKAINFAFWKSVTPDSNLLQGATCISTKAGDEVELLVAAAGADVWKLYESESPEQDLKLLRACFGVDVPRRKLNDILKKHGIPLVSMRNIAQVLTEQKPELLDPSIAEAVALRKQERDASSIIASKEAHASVKNNSAAVQSERTQSDTKIDTSVEEEQKEEDDDEIGLHRKQKAAPGKLVPPAALESSKTKGSATRTSENGESKDGKYTSGSGQQMPDDAPETHHPQKISVTSSKRMDNRENNNMGSEEVERSLDSSSAMKQQTKDSQNDNSGTSRETSDKAKRAPATEPLLPRKEEENKKSFAVLTASSQSSNKPTSERTEGGTQSKQKRSRLSAGAGGWLEVAPKEEKKRRLLVRSDQEILEIAGYDTVLPRAITKKVSGLVGQSSPGPIAWKARTARNKSGVPDFRAFRKNVVVGGGTVVATAADSQSSYILRIHRPKESAGAGNSYKLEEQRQALEEQQRRADALFRDTGGARTAPGRGRK